jgi:hypothetical protein
VRLDTLQCSRPIHAGSFLTIHQSITLSESICQQGIYYLITIMLPESKVSAASPSATVPALNSTPPHPQATAPLAVSAGHAPNSQRTSSSLISRALHIPRAFRNRLRRSWEPRRNKYWSMASRIT